MDKPARTPESAEAVRSRLPDDDTIYDLAALFLDVDVKVIDAVDRIGVDLFIAFPRRHAFVPGVGIMVHDDFPHDLRG